jgi:hypothetical protein
MKNFLLLIISILFCVGFADAQVQEQLSPEERKQLTKITEPVTLYKGFFRSRVSAFYFSADKSFDENGKRIAYPNISGSGVGINMIFQYGITDRLEAEVLLPYQSSTVESAYFYQIPLTGEVGVERGRIETKGLGDIAASLRYQVLQDKPGSPAIVVGVTGYLPTGVSEPTNIRSVLNFKAPSGKGELGLASEIRIRKIAYPFSFEFGAAYISYFGGKKLLEPNAEKVKVTSGAEFLIRPQINFHLNEWVSITNYVDYYSALKDSFDGVDYFGAHNNEYDQWAIRYYPGITFQIKKLRLEQAVMIPMFGKVIPADPMFFFGLDYMF